MVSKLSFTGPAGYDRIASRDPYVASTVEGLAQPVILDSRPERELQERTSGKRIFALDAVRGLAACVVVLHHQRELFRPTPTSWYTAPFFAGTQAVVLFFILSGYVLSLPHWRGRPLPYVPYLVRRLFRIWVPFAIALLLAAAFAAKLGGSHLPLTPFFYRTWHTPITLRLLVQQLLMKGSPELNGAFWSLRYEMVMSIVFPALCWLLQRLRTLASLVFAAACMAGGFYLQKPMIEWAACFILGALLAASQQTIAAGFARIPSVAKWALFAVAMVLYNGGNVFLTTLGACCLLTFAQHSRAQRWLSTTLPEYLGRISYSLYLTHYTVLFATVILLYGKAPLWLIVVIGLCVSFGMAHLFCVCVEEPSTRVGRRLSQSLISPNTGPAPPPHSSP